MISSGFRTGHVRDTEVAWYKVPGDTTRKILVYEPEILMMRNSFTAGLSGPLHSHPHVQASYILSGRFEITIDGRTEELGPGDSFLIQADLMHAAKCLEDGEIIEVFTPIREDFVAQAVSTQSLSKG
jgi:quercetin dioxygenase-like cupin family protein